MKELSIEEKAKAYDEALAKAAKIHRNYKGRVRAVDVVIEEVFPELAESEDDTMWKLIKKYAHCNISDMALYADHITREQLESWLEKQGERKSTNPWEPAKQYCEGVKEVVKHPTNYGLQKQGEQKPYTSETMNEKGDFDNGFTRMLEKEQKSANKVEPKFKVGDWVIDKQNIVHQIANVIENVTNHTYGYDIVDGGYFNDNTEGVRLWTIKDAKDGDVLTSDYEGGICTALLKNVLSISEIEMYCHLINDDLFIPKSGYSNAIWHPATKEQRDLLFQKMREAGYEWDANKKELKKIEQESTWNEKVKGLNEIETYILSLVPDRPLDAIKVDAKNIRYIINKKQTPTWSEEDETMITNIIIMLKEGASLHFNKKDISKGVDWLKSLKDRVQPKQEWSEEGKQYLKIEGYENLSDYEKIFDDIADKYVRNKNQKGYNQSWYVKERAAEMLYHAKKELEKKESWSEKDVRNIQDIDSVLFYDKNLPEDTCMRLRNWLKSLRPQNRWKPSDEQIHYLSWIANVKLGDSVVEQEVSKHLNELLEDLKKLREE